MEDTYMTFNMNGGQFNLAKDNATINATQNNGINASELDSIIKSIMENLSNLKKEDAESIIDAIEMVREELAKPEPKVSRLRSCVTLLAPMLTITNGMPTLASNLQGLIDYITPFIR